jgi:hypothetical protein
MKIMTTKDKWQQVKQSEITRCFVGFSHDIGHRLTFLVLTDDTKTVISRSRVTLIKTEENNLKLDDDFGKLPNWIYVWSKHDGKEDNIKFPMIDVNFCLYKAEYNSMMTTSQHQMKSWNWSHAQP